MIDTLRVRLDELPHRLVPVQTAQVLEGFPGEDERVPQLPVVRRHRSPRPLPAPFGEHGIYESRSHTRLVAQEHHKGLALLVRRFSPPEKASAVSSERSCALARCTITG